MLNVPQILVSARRHAALVVCLFAGAAVLSGCGQRGALYLPKDAAAASRATLPELMTPRMPGASDNAAPAPAAAASAPGVAR
ncbi:LPS translocon maturation chaperone LptM [Variovorax sp. PAMC 28711]|uniref:LPS translocon maturation chaperone LptM n=1 Tax=Variovorax sp. PAMC 28711 TaxID=1795631 RepID=UPI00078C20DA|nr:lipoprotein [Variovorax sp. PAMC 28711]AMM23887.1 hypothetical protein AX767_05650 [Variovorax sp. PAMC 28711]